MPLPAEIESAAVNLSYVLHAPSTSATVASAVSSSMQRRYSRRDTELVIDGDPSIPVDAWLVPSVGFPEEVGNVLGPDVNITVVDKGHAPQRTVTFFRAPASLTLPEMEHSEVGVAALIGRPGGTSRQLIVRGPFHCPEDESEALRSLESIIQAHVEQWRPAVRLWQAPAEQVLPELMD